MSLIQSGKKTAANTPAALATSGSCQILYIHNEGTDSVRIGGPDMTSTSGYPVKNGDPLDPPIVAPAGACISLDEIYVNCPGSTATVSWLAVGYRA